MVHIDQGPPELLRERASPAHRSLIIASVKLTGSPWEPVLYARKIGNCCDISHILRRRF